MRQLKVGVDSYSLKPLDLSPFELLEWAVLNGAEGVQFSEVNVPPGAAVDGPFLDDLRGYAAENRLYVEWGGGQHIPLDLDSGRPKDIAASNRRAADQARRVGSATVRSCSGGLMRWKKDGPSTDELLRLTAASLREQRPAFRDAGVILAIETHFEFTSFELLRLFEMCGAAPGQDLGICLDTMNLLTLLEDPVSAARRLLPWVVTTHIKDGGLALVADGFVSFTAEAGRGVIDLAAIIGALAAAHPRVTLTVEDHGGDFLIPVNDPDFLAGFPDLTTPELVRLQALSVRTRALMDAGKLAVLPRDRWPEACEARVKRDLKAVRRLLAGGLE